MNYRITNLIKTELFEKINTKTRLAYSQKTKILYQTNDKGFSDIVFNLPLTIYNLPLFCRYTLIHRLSKFFDRLV